ncbi:MAG: 2'-5' RNA ligase family protein [Tardiphaga sp.]
MDSSAPTYILTAEMDADSFAWLDGLRRRHFPKARNVLSAHLTMFHRLSTAQIELLAGIDLPSAPLDLHFDGPVFLGAGVAIRVRSQGLDGLRQDVRSRMADALSRQDAQTWKSHVTVQNKVTPDVARTLYRTLEQDFTARRGHAAALLVWEYLGGPWKLERRLPFAVAP